MATEDLIKSHTVLLASELFLNVNSNFSSISFDLNPDDSVNMKLVFSRFGENEKENGPQITGVFEENGFYDLPTRILVSVQVKRESKAEYLRFSMDRWWPEDSDYIMRSVDRYAAGLAPEASLIIEVQFVAFEEPLKHLVYVRDRFMH